MNTPNCSHHPTGRHLLAIGLTAILLRLALCLASMHLGGLTLTQFAELRDGEQYMAVAHAWLGDFDALTALGKEDAAYAMRLFPLYPAVMGLLHGLGIPMALAALLPNWIITGLIAAAAAVLFGDRRVGWAMALLTPSFLLNSVLISTEAMSLLLCLAAILSGRRGRWLLAGFAFGLAGLARPVAIFAALGYFVMQLGRKQAKQGVLTGLIAAAAFAAGLGLVHLRFGDALASFTTYAQNQQAYGGQLLAWPFQSLITTPMHFNVATWKIAYVWLHVLATLGACTLMIRRVATAADTQQRTFEWMIAIWLWTNTLFVLCVGDRWGFDEFHRFIVPALPALFWPYAAILPRSRWSWLWVPITAVSLAFAYQGLSHGFDKTDTPTLEPKPGPLGPDRSLIQS